MRQPPGRSARRASVERKPREERWSEIIELATQVFYEKSYDGASLQDIADRLGMLKGSLYYYIHCKEDLLYEVIRMVHEEGFRVVQSSANVEGDALQRLENVIIGHVVHTCRHLVSTTVFLHELEALPIERRREILGAEHAYQGVFRELIETGQEEQLVRSDVDPRLAALSVLGSSNWVYRWYRDGGSFTPQAIGQRFADMSIRGIATLEVVKSRYPETV